MLNKWQKCKVSHAELRLLCWYLRDCCAPYRGKTQEDGSRGKGAKRTLCSIVWAWQVYLIVAIFVYVVVRQQEVRQYQEEKTLFLERNQQGESLFVARNISHKLQRKTQKKRNYYLPLPSTLVRDLEQWFQVYRPLAVQATRSLEDWLSFYGYRPDTLESLQQRLEQARQGNFPPSIKNQQRYIERLEIEIRQIERRIAAWPIAKANLEHHDLVFFSLGHRHPESFGKPLSRTSVWSLVTGAVAEASKAVLGRECRLNPHKFRHVAAFHIRQIRGDKKGLAILSNHSEEMGDEYAAQLQDEIALTEKLIHWWDAANEAIRNWQGKATEAQR